SHALSICSIVFVRATPTTDLYTLSLHDALPIFAGHRIALHVVQRPAFQIGGDERHTVGVEIARRLVQTHHAPAPGIEIDVPDAEDRKSTRLNSSHLVISYAVFCLKKKKHPHRPA